MIYLRCTCNSINLQHHRTTDMRHRNKAIILVFSFSKLYQDVEYSLSIISDFFVIAYRSNIELSMSELRGILGFQYRLTLAQMDTRLVRLKVVDLQS